MKMLYMKMCLCKRVEMSFSLSDVFVCKHINMKTYKY